MDKKLTLVAIVLLIVILVFVFWPKKKSFMENNQNFCIEFEEYTNNEFRLFNPGVFVLKDEIYLVFRYCNFYSQINPKTIITELLLYKYKTGEHIWLNFTNLQSKECNKQGMEDPKVILDEINNSLYIYASTFDEKCNTVLCRLEYDIDTIENCFKTSETNCNPKTQKLLKYDKTREIEKNWMPFKTSDNKIYLVYSVYPLIILEEEREYDNNIVYKEILNVKHESLKNARGTSNGILLNNDFVFIIHEKPGTKDYLNGFMFLENKYPFNLKSNTKCVKFVNKPIEFPNGLCTYNDKLLISFGINDNTSGILLVDTDFTSTLKNDLKTEYVKLKNIMTNVKFSETENGKFFYDVMDMTIAESYKNGNIYESDLVNKILREYIEKSKVIVDVGANIGTHCVSYGNMNNNCKIYAFEPQKELFEILSKNVKLNNLENTIKLYNKALGHKFDKLNLQPVPENQPFNKGGTGIGVGGEECEVVTLDSLNLDSCDFIKMDVEGAEPLVIMGGIDTIKSYKPVIMFEYNGNTIKPDLVGLKEIPDTIELIKSLGYNNITQIDAGNYIAKF